MWKFRFDDCIHGLNLPRRRRQVSRRGCNTRTGNAVAEILESRTLLTLFVIDTTTDDANDLTGVADGQLSRLPFEMLRVGDKFLVEEKAISYVGSGREIARLAQPAAKGKSS